VTDVEDEAVPAMQISVVQALPKGDRGELAVELLTEIGVDAIVPWSASRCITQWKGERGDKGHRKWLDAAAAAGKQSRRARFPVVHPLSSTAQVCDLISAASATLVLDENASLSLADVALPDSGDVVVVVGPEGGIAGDELDRFVRAGAVAVRLGPTVLRTSTAGLAAASIVLSRSSRWAGPSHTRSVEG
jgi:16S rRNA (uracil1498-N3)-methyltransferase